MTEFISARKDIDRLQIKGRLLDGLMPGGFDAVYFHDNFDEGFNSWQDHSTQSGSTHTWYPPVSLSTQRVFGKSRHSLRLGTSDQTTAQLQLGGSISSYRRLARTHETGYVGFGAWLAYRGTAEQAAPASIMLGVDTQKWDESSRMFGKLILRRWVGQAPDAFTPKWVVVDDSGADVDLPNAVAGIPAAPVAGKGAVFGWNENKSGFFFAMLIMDLAGNGGLGSYHRAIIGNQIYNLTGLGAGRGLQPPQNSTSGGSATSYAGGLNFGFTMNNRTATADGPAALFVGEAMGLHWPAGTVFA